jgi:dTMP kinase
LFISFEGIEGCGKSTQARYLADRLRGLDIPVLSTMEPGGTRVGQDIRRILLDRRNKNLSPLAELLLYASDRAQHVHEVIKPALEQGKWVVCDRYFDATLAYQGHARGQEMGFIKTLNQKASVGIYPDITFLIDCPVSVGIERALRRNKALPEEGQDRFEKERQEFHACVREGYLTVAREEPERFVVVDGILEEKRLAAVIFEHIRPFLVPEDPEGF